MKNRNLLRNLSIVLIVGILPLTLLGAPLKLLAAGPPSILSYQGRLTNASGSLLGGSAGTTYYFKFSLWNASTGGSKLWPTSDPISFATTVREGVFNVNIGDTANGYPDTLDYNFSGTNVFLKVEVSSNGTSFETLSPRQQLSSVAFAQVAGTLISASSTATNFTAHNATTSAATSTNFFSTNLWSTVLNNSGLGTLGNLLVSGSSTLQNFTFINATGTSATTTNFFSTIASSTNLYGANINGFGLSTCNGSQFVQWSGGLFGCGSVVGGEGSSKFSTSTNNLALFPSGGNSMALVLGGNATTTTGPLLEVLGGLYTSGSTTLQNFTFRTATGTSATTTNLFSTTASSTNLFSTALNTGNATLGAITSGLINSQNISSAASFTGTLNVTSGLTTLANLLLTGSSTLQNFTFINATGTQATTTNFAISGIASSLLKTNGSGSLLAAVAGTDYENPLTFNWPITRSSNTISWSGLATTSNPTAGNLFYSNGTTGLVPVATSSVSNSTGISFSGTAGALVGGSALSISIDQTFSPTWTGSHIFNNITRSTSTSATSTSFFATTASSTNLFAAAAQLGSLTIQSALGASSGGTSISSPTAAGILLGSYAGGSWQQLATSSLGLLTTNVAEGSNLYYTDARVNSYIHASTTIPKTYTANTFTGAQIFNSITRSTTTAATTTNFHISNLFTFGGDVFDELVGIGLELSNDGDLTASLGTSIEAFEIANEDHGDFTYSGGLASLDANTVGDSEIDTTAAYTWTGAHIFNNITRSTTTSATTTNLFSTTASSTNLFSSLFTLNGFAITASGAATLADWFDQSVKTTASPTFNALTLSTDLSVANGGTGASTLTGLLQGNGASAFTAITDSSTVGQVLRVTGASTYAWGALNLADTDAITGDLPFANLAQVSANSVLANPTGALADAQSVATSTLFGGAITAGQVLMSTGSGWTPAATATCVQITGSAELCDGDDEAGGVSAYDAWTHPSAGVSATTSAMIFTNASSTFTGNLNITGNSTTTSATTTNLFSTTASSTNLFSTNFHFGGVNGNSWDDFCVSITGATSLCDGDDASGAGSSFAWTVQSYGVSTSTRLGFLNGFLSTASSTIDANLTITGNSTTTNATTTQLHVSSIFNFGGDVFDELVGTGLQITNGDLQTTLGTSIAASEIADGDHGDFTYSGSSASLDADVVGDSEIDTTAAYTWTGAHIFNNITRSTTTSATTTNLFSTVASSSNLFAAAANLGSLTAATLIANTANLTESGNLFYTDARVNSYIHSSTTIPKTYSANTFTGAQIFDSITRSTSTSATSTNFFATTASSTNLYSTSFFGGGLSTCQSNNVLTWAGGIFGCEADDSGSGSPFAWTVRSYGVSTSTTLGFLNGFLSTASSTIDSNLTITGNSTSTNATTTQFHISSLFNFGGDIFDELVGTGLQVSGGDLQTTLGTAITLSELADGDYGDITLITPGGFSIDADTVGDSEIDTTASYTWTGAHIFNSITRSTTTSATSTNFFATTASTTNFFGAGLSTCESNNVLTWSGGRFGCEADDSSAGGNPNSKWATSTADTLAIHVTDAHRVGIGTTTPKWNLQLASSTGPQLALTDSTSITTQHWTFRNAGGNLYLATSSAATFATTSISALEIAGNGFGTTTIRGLNIVGKATSTSNVGHNITSGCYAINNVCVGGGGSGDAGFGVEAVRVHTANGTWTKPAYVNNVYVQVWGGGGGGLTANANNSMGGGGGGGYSAGIVGVSGNVSVVVGAGGGNNANGAASSFPGAATLTGNGGVRPTTVTGGAGGTAANGTINLTGQAGGFGQAADGAKSGSGGASPLGGAGGTPTGGANAAGGARAGGNGAIPGGGGAGGEEATGAAGTGANGMVIIWELSGTNGSDLAEFYETEEGVEPGDVVSISSDSIEYESEWGLQRISVLEKAKPGNKVVGVISTAPHTVMGRSLEQSPNSSNAQPVALAGRVPVKVSLENGPIKAGDLLIAASESGLAAKMLKSGEVIGAALEDYEPPPDGSPPGKVMMFVETGYSAGARTNALLERAGFDVDTIPAELDIGRLMLAQLLVEKKNITATTTLSEIFTDRVVAALEIISPRVVTDTLVVNAIEPMESNVRMRIVEGGKFILERVATSSLSITFGTGTGPPGTQVMTIDELGNAFFAGALTGASLEIGSAEKPNGITFYDTATGEPYCTRVTNGDLVTTAGKCGSSAPSVPASVVFPTEESAGTSEPAATSSEPIVGESPPTATTTEPVITEPEPELAAEEPIAETVEEPIEDPPPEEVAIE